MASISGNADHSHLIETYRDYAHALASEIMRKLPPNVERSDVLGAADLGLVEAASSFDPRRGVHFKTFAYYRVRGAIYDALRKMGWFSKTQYDQFKFEMAANEYMKDAVDAPPPRSSAAEDLQQLRSATGSIVSCYLLSIEAMTRELPDAKESPEDLAADQQERTQLREAMKKLPDKNRQVLEGYYFQNQSLEEIGSRLGLSKSWVSRVHAKSLEMIREILVSAGAGEATFAGGTR